MKHQIYAVLFGVGVVVSTAGSTYYFMGDEYWLGALWASAGGMWLGSIWFRVGIAFEDGWRTGFDAASKVAVRYITWRAEGVE